MVHQNGDGLLTDKPFPPGALSSMAYLMNIFQNEILARELAITTVERDVVVQMEVGERSVTNLNVVLLVITGMITVLICGCLMLASVWGWWTVGKERKEYNGFCDVDDAGGCLLREMMRFERRQETNRIWMKDGELVFWRKDEEDWR